MLIIRVDWFPEEGVSYSLSPSQESTALSCDGLKVLALISFSALFEWFYIIFAYINISGIGMHFIITDILAWIQLDRLMYPEKAMAPHSSTLAWKVPWTRAWWLLSVGLLRVGHDWATSLSLFTFMHWRRKWQPTPVFLPGESQERGNLMGCGLWGCAESDMTEAT